MHDAPRGTVSETGGEPAESAGTAARAGFRNERSATAERVIGETRYLPGLHWYAVFVTLSIVVLICSGGMVTSNNAGLAVPDWPNSYGYNMFAFPVSRWVGGSAVGAHASLGGDRRRDSDDRFDGCHGVEGTAPMGARVGLHGTRISHRPRGDRWLACPVGR